MTILYITTLFIISNFISYKIGYNKCYKLYKNKIEFFSKEKGGRFGTIRITGSSYGGSCGTIEFREVARSVRKISSETKTWIKIDIIDVYPDSGNSKQKVLSGLRYDEWILENDSRYEITWYEDNSQRIRDERINEILK